MPLNQSYVESSCATCGYPIAVHEAGEIQACPSCGAINQTVSGVNIPDPIFWGGLGFLAGVMLTAGALGKGLKMAKERGVKHIEL